MTDRTEDFSEQQSTADESHLKAYQWLLESVSKAQLLDELQKQHSRVAELEAAMGDLERTKELLADCEAKHGLIEQNMLDTLMAFDASLRLLYCSPSVKSLTGFTVEEVVGRRIEKIVTPASLKAFMSRFAEQLNQELKRDSVSFDIELITKEQSIVSVLGRLRIVWEDDVHSRILLVIQDVRGQKLMEKALLQEAQRYRIFFQRAQEPMSIVTPQGTLVEVNDAWTKLLGYPPQEVLGLNVKTIMPEFVLAYTESAETSSSDWETWLNKRDGSIITCLITAITWAGSEQTLLGHLFIVRNRKETEG